MLKKGVEIEVSEPEDGVAYIETSALHALVALKSTHVCNNIEDSQTKHDAFIKR